MVALKVLFDEAMKKQRKKEAVNRGLYQISHNKTGFRWLVKIRDKKYKNNYCWRYERKVDGQRVVVYATDLVRVFDKVKDKGYDWVMLDEEKAQKTVEGEGWVWFDFVEYMLSHGGYVDYSNCMGDVLV